MIYAVPPMVRNVMLGLDRVPPDIIDSARMAGTTKRQLLWWVQLPSALPTIMMGVNQTIMAALTMVIIASLIGGVNDIGFEVLSTLRKAKFGQSLLAGAVIVLIAMVLDRISRAAAERQSRPHRATGSFWQRHRHAGFAAWRHRCSDHPRPVHTPAARLSQGPDHLSGRAPERRCGVVRRQLFSHHRGDQNLARFYFHAAATYRSREQRHTLVLGICNDTGLPR